MAARQVVLVFISTLLFAAAQAEGGNAEDGQKVDIRKFLQQSPKIMVYEATETGNKMCVTDYYSTVTKTDVLFTRYFTEDTKKSNFPLRGVFGPTEQEQEGPFFKMSVYYPQEGSDSTQFSEEVMLYLSSTGNCGVFNVTDYTGNKESWYDVRIKKHDSVDFDPTSCLKFYNDIRKKTPSRRVYEDSCTSVPSNSDE